MTRVPVGLAVAALLALDPEKDQPDNTTVYRLTTTPAAAPVPALRYEFAPRPAERTRGNAALDYARAVQLLPPWPDDPEASRALDLTLVHWEEVPLDDFPLLPAGRYLATYADGFAALDAAALRDHCDWPATNQLADVQQVRAVMRFSRLRVRRELARRNFDAAAGAIRSGMRLARHTSERPNGIQLLVGISFLSMSCGDATQFVGRPRSPNLYAALASLPRPLVDIRPGLDGSAAAFDAELPNPAEWGKAPVGVDVADRAATKMFAAAALELIDGPQPEPPTGAELTARVEKAAPAARAFLLAHGRKAHVVEKLPPSQAVVLAVADAKRVFRDEQYVAFLRPYPQVWPEVERVQKRAAAFEAALADPLLKLFTEDLRFTWRVYDLAARLERRVAQLTAVEAVRLYAAAHDGRPPAQLADIVAVPVPADPLTGLAFVYAVRADGFTLTAPPPAGEKASRVNNVRFEVTFRP